MPTPTAKPDRATHAEPIPLVDGEAYYWPDWIAPDEADVLFTKLRDELAWEQSRITLFGKQHLIPRLNAWYADPGLTYTYSNTTFEPHPWTDTLMAIRHHLKSDTGHTFNSVLANLYRDGRDSNGWHSDNEPELGNNPVIASLSLGAPRKFHLKHRTKKHVDRVHLTLDHGSLLLMTGATQHHWAHQVPKTAKPVAPRINLTFRWIVQVT